MKQYEYEEKIREINLQHKEELNELLQKHIQFISHVKKSGEEAMQEYLHTIAGIEKQKNALYADMQGMEYGSQGWHVMALEVRKLKDAWHMANVAHESAERKCSGIVNEANLSRRQAELSISIKYGRMKDELRAEYERAQERAVV